MRSSGVSYTIIRPGGLNDGPMVSDDRKLLTAQGDKGSVKDAERDISRQDVAAVDPLVCMRTA